MRSVRLLLLMLLLSCGPRVVAQEHAAPPRLADELCSCMGTVDLSSSDRVFEGQVRSCLEEAIVHHPGEALALLKRHPSSNGKAFQLGLLLGGSLERECPGFLAVKARLQQAPPSPLLKKQGT